MDEKQHLREVAAELEGSKLTRPQRADAQAQLARGTTSAAPTEPAKRSERSEAAMASAAPASLEPTVAAIESRFQRPPTTGTTPATPPAATTTANSPSSSASPSNDPLRKLVEQLTTLQPRLAETDPRLAKDIAQLAAAAQQSGTVGQTFQTRLAYAFQDAERIVGPLHDVPAGLRNQMLLLATTLPSLRNDRLQSLLRATPDLADAALVRQIRRAAAAVSREDDQHSVPIMQRIDTLTERVPQALRLSSSGTAPTRAAEANPAITTVNAQAQHLQPATPPNPGQPQPAIITHEATGPRALLSVFRTLREPRHTGREPWDAPAAPLGPRLAAVGDKVAARHEQESLTDAERAGRAALDALNGFAHGPGAGVMTKIREAARHDPKGVQGVLAEMREGGKYAELRTQFNTALTTERGLAASYDRAAVALSQYGAKRTAADTIISRRPDAAALNGRFETLDAEIGQTSSTIPGRKDGKSALDEVAEKAREIMTKAVDAVRSLFGRGATAGTNARATASPSPGPAGP